MAFLNLQKLCYLAHNYHQCFKRIENHQLKKHPQVVKRDGDKLFLSLQNGKQTVLKNDHKSADSLIEYVFQFYLKEFGFYVVGIQYYEGTGILFVNNENGKQTKILGGEFYDIRFSPDSKVFISSNSLTAAQYNAEGIEIWKIAKNKLTLTYEQDKAGFMPEPKWLGSNKILIHFPIPAPDWQPRNKDFYLEFLDGAWARKEKVELPK